MKHLIWLVVLACMAGCSGSPSPPGPPSNPPARAAPTTSPTTAESADIQALLARPRALPAVPAGKTCPITRPRMHSPVAQPADARGPGRGPLFPITFYLGEDSTLRLSGETPGPDGLYAQKVVWASTTGMYRGPVVVRVSRIDGSGRGHVRLTDEPDAAHGDAALFVVGDEPRDWPALTYVTGPGCYAYQLDGRTFTDVIVFRVVAPPHRS